MGKELSEEFAKASRLMSQDWDCRAAEDASYYVAFGRRHGQGKKEFLSSAREVVEALKYELENFLPGTDLSRCSALEIGCGPGRVLVYLSRIFGKVWGVDVSGKMIELARKNLEGVGNAFVSANNGCDLSGFGDNSIDFCYSYAVFQHIPDKNVVLNYLSEAERVLKPGGIFTAQFNCSPQPGGVVPVPGWSVRAHITKPLTADNTGIPDTWSGVKFRPEEIAAFLEQNNFQLLHMTNFDTQHFWLSARKKTQSSDLTTKQARIIEIMNEKTNSNSVIQTGKYAAASAFLSDLPQQADLNNLRIVIGKRKTAPFRIRRSNLKTIIPRLLSFPFGKYRDVIDFYLPPGIKTGVFPVSLSMNNKIISSTATLRVIPPPVQKPKILGIRDATSYFSNSVTCGIVRIDIEETGLNSVSEIQNAISCYIDGKLLPSPIISLIDPLAQRYFADFSLPEDIPNSKHNLTIMLAGKKLKTTKIRVNHLKR